MGVSQKRMDEINKFLSKENLEKYLKIYSANYIAKELFAPEFTSTAGTVIERAKVFGIKTHDISSSKKLENTKKLIKTRCIQKYGVDNVSKSEIIKEKKKQSAIKRYGVENVFQSEIIKTKIYSTCLAKYGVEKIGWVNLSKLGNRSKFHQKIEKILISLKIDFRSEVTNQFKKYNEYFKKEYSPIVDILLMQYKIVIECHGDFWHANPKIYKPTDIFHCWDGAKTAQEIWDRDRYRTIQIESFGYKVLVVWESDLLDIQQLKRKIKHAISCCKNQTNKKNTKKSRK